MFIASIFFFCGETYPALIIAQILVSLGTLFVTYLLAAKLWNHQSAIIAAVFLLSDLASFINSQQVLTDTLFTFVLSLAVLIGLSLVNAPEPGMFRALSAIFLLAFAAFIRPIANYLIFPLMLTFMTIWRTYGGWQWKKIAATTIILFTPWGILIGGWQLRNYLIVGETMSSTKQWEHLLFYIGAHIVAQRDGIPFEEARNQKLGYGRYSEVHPETVGWSRAKLIQQWKHEGLDLIRQHP